MACVVLSNVTNARWAVSRTKEAAVIYHAKKQKKNKKKIFREPRTTEQHDVVLTILNQVGLAHQYSLGDAVGPLCERSWNRREVSL